LDAASAAIWELGLAVMAHPGEIVCIDALRSSLAAMRETRDGWPKPDSLAALCDRQADERMHPYTCLHHSDTMLLPTSAGWRCPMRFCDYRQPYRDELPAPPQEKP